MSKVVSVKKIQVPSDLAERLDLKHGKERGTTRNLMAEDGKLHDIDNWLMTLTLAREIKPLLEDPSLPAKPRSLQRFSDMLWVISIANITGTMSWADDGTLLIGGDRDIVFMARLMAAEKVKLSNGVTVDKQRFVSFIQHQTSVDYVKNIYDEIAGRGIFKNREVKGEDRVKLAYVILKSNKEMVETLSKK